MGGGGAGGAGGRVVGEVESRLGGGGGLGTGGACGAGGAMGVGGGRAAARGRTGVAVLVVGGGGAAGVAAGMGFGAMDDGALEAIVDGLIAEYDEDWAAFTSGDDKERKKKSGFFVGQIMKATNGQADGRAVNELLARRANR